MGQDHSNGKRGPEAQFYGDVFVKLDQDTYLSDDTLTGTVYVSLRQPYPGDKLCLKVKGKEFTKWIDRETRYRPKEDGTQEAYTVEVPREAEFVSVKHVVDIYDWRVGTTIPPGQFSFPISFKIPAGLPSSFFLRSGTTVAEIQYYVEAYLAPEKDLYPKIKHKRSITIRQALKTAIETKEVSINKEVSTCCCCSKGRVSMWTAFEKNAYTPGESARVVTEIDNSQCSLAVTNVRFELSQSISLSANGHGKSLHFGICGQDLGRVEPGQSFLKEQRKEASVQLPPAIEGSSKSFKGENQVTEYSLSPQQAISPTTNGTLVKSNFHLGVSCGMDGCVCDAMPTTSLPVTIYSIIQRKVVDPSPPPGWNPQPMPAANLSITINVNGATININAGGAGQPQAGNPFMATNAMPPQQMATQPPIQQQPQNNFNQPPQNNFNQPQNNFATNSMPPQQMAGQPQVQQQPQNNFNQPQNNYNQQPQNNFNQQPQNNFNQQPQNNFNQQPQNNYNQQQPQNNYNQQPQNNYNQQQPQNNYNQQQGQGPQQMNSQGYPNNYGNPNQYGGQPQQMY